VDDRARRNLRTARAQLSPAVAANSPPTPASSASSWSTPDSRASDLADAYGLRIAEAERELAMGELLAVRLGRPPVVGDRVDIGAFALTVREMGDKGRITALGLKCPPFGSALRRAALAARCRPESAVRAAAAAML
jgi:NhaP-type Na+/H+ and K+/H+ antiporter